MHEQTKRHAVYSMAKHVRETTFESMARASDDEAMRRMQGTMVAIVVSLLIISALVSMFLHR